MTGSSTGIIRRALAEYRYITLRRWTYDDVGRHWDSTTDYDDINRKAYSYFRRFIDGLRLSGISDRSYILDICSRTGNGTLHFYNNGKVRSAVCADVSRGMLDVCRANLKDHKIDGTTAHFNGLPLPFRDGEFDAVLCFETVEHMPEPAAFVKELARVVKPGGRLLLTTPNILWEPGHWFVAIFNLHHSEGPHRFLTRHHVLQMAREAGLALQTEETTVLIPAGPKTLLRFGEFLERVLPKSVLRALALRRIFAFRAAGTTVRS